MKYPTHAFFLALSLLAAACATPTQPPVATPLPLVPSATLAAANPTLAPASATPAAPTAPPAVATTAAPAAATAATATANRTVAGGLVGFWKGNNNSYYLLNKDGTWSWDQDGERVLTAPENQGRWWVEGDVFKIQDLTGQAPCPSAQIGAYQAQLSGDALVLTRVQDPCLARIDQTAGQYSRQPAGP